MIKLGSFVLAVLICLNVGVGAAQSIYKYDLEQLESFKAYFEGLSRKIVPPSPYSQASAACTPAKKQNGRRLSFSAFSPSSLAGGTSDAYSPMGLAGNVSPMSLGRSVSPCSAVSFASACEMASGVDEESVAVLSSPFDENAIRSVLKCLKLAIKWHKSNVQSPPRPGFGERSSLGGVSRSGGKSMLREYCADVVAVHVVYSEIHGAVATAKANLAEAVDLALGAALTAGCDVEAILEEAFTRDDELYFSRFV